MGDALNAVRTDLSAKFTSEDSTKIYRYMPLGQLLSIVETKCLSLTKAMSAWDDPHEGALLNEMFRAFHRSFIAVDETISITEKEWDNAATRYRNLFYGTSWSTLKESDAMWRIYSPQNQGVKVQSTVGKLKSTLKRTRCPKHWNTFYYSVGRVHYGSGKVLDKYKPDFAHMFLIKRKPFSHEDEVRGVVHPISFKGGIPEPTKQMAFEAPIPDDFVEEVVIDPRASSWFVKAVEKYCHNKGIKNCFQSDLYDPKRCIW